MQKGDRLYIRFSPSPFRLSSYLLPKTAINIKYENSSYRSRRLYRLSLF
jgi:hypothetical protein